MTTILQRVKGVGTCPPSLLNEERATNEDNFDEAVQKVLDPTIPSGLTLGTDVRVEADFEKLLEMTSSIDSIPGSLDPASKALTLEQRRAVVIAIVGTTPASNESLKLVLESGVLVAFKSWIEDILNDVVGGIDLLLHILSSIRDLPVTKSIVKSSGMGKVIGTIEKHRLCSGSANEEPIRSRVALVKNAWNASVKLLVDKGSPESKKRTYDEDSISPNGAKKMKPETSAFASLMKKVGSSPPARALPISKPPFTPAAFGTQAESTSEPLPGPAKPKSNKRVKWADHFGGSLDVFKEIESNDGEQPNNDQEETAPGGASWQDRKKRDRLREKELLAKAKRSKLTDDDDDMSYGTANLASSMKPATSWHPPKPLAERTDVTAPTVESKEMHVQNERMKNVNQARYRNEYDVPASPAPMSDVEQALDMTSQASAIVGTIPFFVPQAPAPAPVALAPAPMAMVPMSAYGAPPPPPVNHNSGASVDFVSSLGLPMFLVGANQQALQTLASTPSLLNTFVDGNGMYDQVRLMALVQTLSQSMAPTQMPTQNYQPQHNTYGQPPPAQGGLLSSYAPPPAPGAYNGNPYGPAGGSAIPRNGEGSVSSFRSDQNNSEGNLHVSGFGPMTSQAEIIQMFAPYVHVHEVVMKGTFCFVNTRDPAAAARAREALNGTYLGGMPIRINLAQRRHRDVTIATTFGGAPGSGTVTYGGQAPVSARPPPALEYGAVPAPLYDPYGGAAPAPAQVYGGVAASTYGSGAVAAPPPRGPPPGLMAPPPQRSGIDVNAVRDDRGNPATKNLFVAGYGPGTSESHLRELFSQHAIVTGCVMKGSFTFVNTGERIHACVAREALMGTMVNGGVLRVNFAKETGRLGTSFDLTYGPSTAQRNTQYGPAGRY